GDIIFLVGKSTDDLGSSEYLHKLHSVEFSPAPHFDLEEEFVLQQTIASLIKQKIIASAHDVSEGGLFTTLLEASFNNDLGFDVVASDSNIRKDAFWFGESQSRVVVTVKEEKVAAFKKVLDSHPYAELGVVTNGSIEVDGMEWGTVLSWKEKYDTAIENLLAGHESEHALTAL
ncbi:MAG TPA: AIR synthase-related protein, partial [Lacibacter sp.]|nr:AIR synthase-related protein [Lacibacter sp.]